MSESINRLFAEAIEKHERIIGYECRDCGKSFESGRDGRQHMFKQHSNPNGLRKIKAVETDE